MPSMFASLIALVPAIVIYGVRYLWRWCNSRLLLLRASSWPTAHAVVDSSYELDESGTKLRTIIGYLMEYYTDEDDEEDLQAWTVGIRYSYRVDGEIYAGTYFLPTSYKDSGLASDAGKSWMGKGFPVRYHADKPTQSLFLERDGAPGKPRIPMAASPTPYVTSLSLKG